jgi:hypothetical protein
MALEFKTCPVCDERHAVQRSGKMSIHTTAAGARCDGVHEEIRAQRAARERLARAAAQPGSKQMAAAREVIRKQDEKEAAKRKKNRENPLYGIRPHREPMNRGIYAVDGARVVSGGLPTLGRGR